ncbi:asparagine synthase-related protein [Herbidospora sp. NBRC 101105]|uniref:asparagine synthase-related protein n=1 Tax=Herbidospora sp. NBRC 101105 TaxID=3032195 RepID=UPI0024A0D2F1|nr:asparagine synthase-related protein [Herbidospora sp. NBRC 101105]GLX94490.1 asparagine synthase [Herbidospora sp. NBRC 101105]
MRIYGTPPSGLVRAVDRGDRRVVFLGHVLATERELRTAPIRELPGAYSCVIVTEDEVELHTDRAGQFPFHISVRGHETLIAHHATLLAALHSRTPDPLSAAIQITCPNVLALTMGRSFFTDVGRYENAHHGPVLPLREALTEAVSRRGPGVSADFSGGIDSTSLAFLAAADGPVDAVVYHHEQLPAADLDAARRAAALTDRITLSVVTGDRETLPYQGIDQAPAVPRLDLPAPGLRAHRSAAGLHANVPGGPAVPRLDLPAPGLQAHRSAAGLDPNVPGLDWPAPGILAHRRAALRLDWARRAGGRVHLTGEGADALFQPPPSYLATLVRHGDLRRWAGHSARLSRLRQASALDLALRAARLAATSHGRALRVLARSLTRPPATTPPRPADAVAWWNVPGETAGWLTPRIRRDLADLAADPATARGLPPGLTPARHATLASLRSAAAAQRFLRTLGDHLGVRVHAPYLDDAVVGAVLDARAPIPDPSRAKPQLADALTGLVPEAVLTRRTKGAYQAEEYAGARAARRRIAALLADSRLADLGVVDPAAVSGTLTRLNAGAPVPLSALGRLVALEVWLRG